MNKFIVLSAITLCLVASHCASGQYQTGPAYGNAYQQQRKMAPAPQSYGQQQETGGDYEQSSMVDEQSKYGSQGAASSMSYGNKQQGGSYGGAKSMMAANAGGYGKQQMAGGSAGYGAKQMSGYGEEPKHAPEPYDFGYNIDDGYQNTQYRKESADEQGKVTGSYGYRDSYGVFRYVDYVADENGFRASLRSNEPGLGKEAPADVQWQVEEPPAETNPGSKSSSYGSAGSSSSYGSMGKSSSGSSYGSGSNGASGSSSYGGDAMTSGSYGSASASGGQSYGRGSSNDNMGGGDYSNSMAMPMAGQMSKYASGSGSSSYGAAPMSMMMATGENMAGRGYGSGNGMMMMAKANQMAGSYGSGSRMGAASAGRSSSYKSMASGRGNQMTKSGAYGSAQSAMADMDNDQYGMGSTMGAEMQQAYGSSQQMDDSQQQYGSSDSGSQQYGGMMMMARGNNNAQSKAYGNASPMDSNISTYSSMRLMNGGNNSGYNNSPGSSMMMSGRGMAGSNYGANAGTKSMMAQSSNAMDYKKAAAKNIAALVKRY